MKKFFLSLMLTLTLTAISVQATEAYRPVYRIHNYKGERVGTCKRDTKVPVIYLYDMNGRKVENPAKYLGEPADDFWLFDVDGLAIGKCSSTRVMLWGR